MSVAKETVGRKAVDYIESGMVVGLGTGSTAYYFVDELGKRYASGQINQIRCVSTSTQTEQQAQSLGLPTVTLDEVDHIDVLVDGADETLNSFSGIKGGGGALLLEKIVAQYSRKIIWIVDQAKRVDYLGAFPLPVEVVQFGAWKLFHTFDKAGMQPSFRKKGIDSLFITDSGNYIIDLHLGKIEHPEQVAFELKNMVGVVEHGLFINYPNVILVGDQQGGYETIERPTIIQ